MARNSRLSIETLRGPESPTIELQGDDPLTIGRGSDNDLVLSAGATVSRKHATLTRSESLDGEIWKICDSGSRHGTFLNGIKLEKWHGVRIHAGDMITIEPFTFQVVDQDDQTKYAQTLDDGNIIDNVSIIRIENTGRSAPYAQEQLAALLACSKAIHTADTEESMASAVATAVCAGTSFKNVAVIRPIGSEGKIQLLAAKGRIALSSAPNISRTLLRAAMEGESVRYQKTDETVAQAQSIVQLGIEVALCIPIKIGSSVAGCLYIDNRDGQVRHQTVDGDIDFCTGLAEITALAMSNLMRMDIERRHAEERKDLLLGTVSALVSAIDAKDTYTRGHSKRVAWLANAIGISLQLEHDTLEQLHICGLVHDIGKIGIPEAILQKPSRLTDEEFDRIKEHPVIGEKILKDVPQLKSVLPGVRSHHERWDGRGYPDGLSEEAIPLYGRIIGVADAFDAMCSSRAYRKALNKDEVCSKIEASAGTQFDPAMIKAFMKIDLAPYEEMIARHTEQVSI